jgi:hypothetical protein
MRRRQGNARERAGGEAGGARAHPGVELRLVLEESQLLLANAERVQLRTKRCQRAHAFAHEEQALARADQPTWGAGRSGRAGRGERAGARTPSLQKKAAATLAITVDITTGSIACTLPVPCSSRGASPPRNWTPRGAS